MVITAAYIPNTSRFSLLLIDFASNFGLLPKRKVAGIILFNGGAAKFSYEKSRACSGKSSRAVLLA